MSLKSIRSEKETEEERERERIKIFNLYFLREVFPVEYFLQ